MIDQPGDPGKTSTYRPRHNEAELYDAAWNAVAIASTHWQQSTGALRYTLSRAQLHGLTTLEMCAASGLDEDSVLRMIDEAE
jgi:hypothetical protein